MVTYLFLNLLFFIHLFRNFDRLSKFLYGFSFYIQSELGENGEKLGQ